MLCLEKGLALDLDNAFYSVAEGLINSFKESNDHEGFKLAAIMNFGIDTAITPEELEKGCANVVAEKLYHEAKTQLQPQGDGYCRQTLPDH